MSGLFTYRGGMFRPLCRRTGRRHGALARLTTGTTAVLGLALALTVTPATPGAVARETAPTNAGKVFQWGDSQWHDGFVTALTRTWKVNRPSLVRNQHGMLTINATSASGTVWARVAGHGQRYGRWEARVRAEQYSADRTPYHVMWELVPTSGYHCGARSIVLADYPLGSNEARMHVRNLPGADFTTSKALDLRPGPFHTYAVEVTPDHVSWFVDTQVVMTERRPEALTGATYDVRFRLAGTPGATMNPGRMQMDWVRYYTLARPGARSIEAPQATRGEYAAAC